MKRTFAPNLGVVGPREIREYTALGSTPGIPTPPGIVGAFVTLYNGGGGGGSGRRGAAASARWGGGAGAGGAALYEYWLPAELWGATYDVGVGAGGAGGAAVTADNTNGVGGSVGGLTLLVTSGRTYRAATSSGGNGGTSASGSGASSSAGAPNGGNGGSSSVTGIGGTGSASPGPTGGGGGGGISTTDVAYAAGSGAPVVGLLLSSGGAPGVVDGTAPSVGLAAPLPLSGQGGGGGAASITKAAQNGADGGYPSGGGGGGGASLNGFASGAGGKGGDGYARITFIYKPEAAPGPPDSYTSGNQTGAWAVPVDYPGTHRRTLTGNVTVDLTGRAPVDPQQAVSVSLVLVQDATGGRTVAFSGVKWPNGVAPVLSAAAGAVDVVTLLWAGEWLGFLSGQAVA